MADPTEEYNLLQLRDKLEQQGFILDQIQVTAQQNRAQMAELRHMLEQLAAKAGVDLTKREPPPGGVPTPDFASIPDPPAPRRFEPSTSEPMAPMPHPPAPGLRSPRTPVPTRHVAPPVPRDTRSAPRADEKPETPQHD